jgi:hypothetical protein
MNRYVLDAIDPATASISHEVSFEIKETAELCAVVDLPTADFNPRLSYPLDTSAVSKLKNHCGLNFDDTGFEVWLRPWHPNPHGESTIPEKEFESPVRAGRFVMCESFEPPAPNSPVMNGQPIGLRRVLYALPNEEWRIDGYLKLWETMKKTGWTEQLEREEARSWATKTGRMPFTSFVTSHL